MAQAGCAALFASLVGPVTAALVALAIVVGLPGLVTSLHLTMLTIASIFYREHLPSTAQTPLRFLILIPAHNEESVLRAALTSINAAIRPRDSVLVVADRCTDLTTAIARAYGAEVLERPPGSRPGRAATRQDGMEAAARLEWDALVMIDADSVLQPAGFLDACERALKPGVDALQVRSETIPGPSVIAQSSVAAFALQGITVPRGRDRLGCSVRLRGTGMVLRRHITERFHFRGPGASEDLWFGLDLCCAGIRIRHIDSATLHSEAARTVRVASGQRLRWEIGRILAAREFLRPLLRRHDRAALEMATHLVTPPLSVAILSLLFGITLALFAHALLVAVLCAAGIGLLGADVIISLIQARASSRTWLSLLAAPWYVVWKGWIQVRAVVRAIRAPDTDFPPTAREALPTRGPGIGE